MVPSPGKRLDASSPRDMMAKEGDAGADPNAPVSGQQQQDTSRQHQEHATRPPAPYAQDVAGDVDEGSPLLGGGEFRADSGSRRRRLEHGAADDDDDDDDDDTSQETKSTWYIIMLTISIAGLQVAWSVELSNGSPYLLSLGLSKSLMALVWMAGPLTGTLVVPYVGFLSDNCRLRWGKRRPFMVGGTAATVAGLLFLGWTREIVGGTLALVGGADPDSAAVRTVVVAAAVAGIYLLDMAINTVQAAIRAFIVDCAPAHQQEEANAMASRLTGLGNIVGYLAGYVDLPTYLWFLGDTQFKILCAMASIGLVATVAPSTLLVRERDPRLGPRVNGTQQKKKKKKKKTASIVSFFLNILRSIRRLPPQTKRVCQVQLLAWVGFFPLLFYTSSYVGEIYAEPYLEANPSMTPDELDALYERATRVGTFALLVNAVVSLLTNVLLPFFIAPTFDRRRPGGGDSAPPPSRLDVLRVPGLTLKRAWLASLLLFSLSMFATLLVRASVTAATTLVALAGITWAMTLWAPWAVISAEVSRRDVAARARKRRRVAPSRTRPSPSPSPPPSSSGDDASRPRVHGHDLEGSHDGRVEEEEADQAGVILGIHNMAIAVPQMVATLGSSLVFGLVQKPRGTPGDRSFATVMALGGIFVLGSCIFALKIEDDARDDTEVHGCGGGHGHEEEGGPGSALLSSPAA